MRIINLKNIYVNTPNNRIKIARYEGPSYLAETLLYDNKPYISYDKACPTCKFLFERASEFIDIDMVEISELIDKMNTGIVEFNDYNLNLLCKVLPNGRYTAFHAIVKPMLWSDNNCANDPDGEFNFYKGMQEGRCSGFDYYHEKIMIAPGIHENVKEKMYSLFVPQQDTSLLSESRVEYYKNRFLSKNKSTVFSLGFLNPKQSYLLFRQKDPGPEHWKATMELVMMHLILDGHHKLYVASQMNQELNIICFLRNTKNHNDDQQFQNRLNYFASSPNYDTLDDIYAYPSNEWVLNKYKTMH